VSSFNTFKVLLTVALVASIAWKIAVATEHQTDWRNGLVEFFERNHFNVVVTEQQGTNVPIIQANRDSCRLQIAQLAPDGSNQGVVRHLFMGTDRLFFVFGGRVYTQQPILWSQIDYLWSERLRELGLIKQIAPVIAVATNTSCNAERLPWAELRETS
jgi:hypothetical protein